MILADKIVKLRKRYGWSQEELAEKMDVSRQSISKWEGASSIPDLNKILMLSKIFGVSTDYLVKDEIEDSEELIEDVDTGLKKVTLEEATLYVHNKSEASKLISKGVLFILYSIVPLFILIALSELDRINLILNTAIAIGFILLFVICPIGVVFIVRTNSNKSDIKKFEGTLFELEYGVKGIFNEKITNYKTEYLNRISIAIVLIMTSAMPMLIAGILSESQTLIQLMMVVMILIIGLSLYIIIPTSILHKTLNFIVDEGNNSPYKRKHKK